MKLKTRLAISFLIILIVPCLLASAAFFGTKHVADGSEKFSLEAEYQYFMNSLHLLNQYSTKACITVDDWLSENKGKDPSDESIKEMDTVLKKNYSYLILTKGGRIVYNGDKDNKDGVKERNLPKYGANDDSVNIIIYTSENKPILLRQFDFSYRNGENGTFFVVTSANSVLPESKRIVADFIISAIVVLLLTAVIMVLWNYRGVVPRIARLSEAADEIKKGNLEIPVEPDGNDEITELFIAFEEMRVRLQKNAEEKMQNEEEQRQLISNIVHDLKTPITAIKGYAEGIIDGVASTPEKRDSYLRTIVHKSNDMNSLINELSLYTKIDTNRIPYNFTMIPVNSYFTKCAEEIGMDLRNQKIEFHFQTEVDDAVKVIADPQQLERVIHNIISNSVKYMGSKTEDDPGSIELRVQDVGDSVQVEIRDNGIGISAKDLPHIFDRLFRADASRNSQTGGSGIGLSIVKKIIDDHGGNIWATSTEGAGTTMYFMLRKKMEEKNVKNTNSRRRRSYS